MIENDLLRFTKSLLAARDLLKQTEAAYDASTAPDDNDPTEEPLRTAFDIWRRLHDLYVDHKPTTYDEMKLQERTVKEMHDWQTAKGHHDDGPDRLARWYELTSDVRVGTSNPLKSKPGSMAWHRDVYGPAYFKAGALNHSATLPFQEFQSFSGSF